ncbi:hypothetical protein FJR38_14965 [Anabaena sp. UHCC 0253]|uniref:hypothetical protein n=1 Tax=Anabaena sp. UHCC 0253 TaxID=2590019 RepID=UPI001444E6FB|nr:hypothetical protein [Anabaena sp. UHCC 0253]MTJ53854.1 hypothetical protein [Anabaena sp. UHCC 0253]
MEEIILENLNKFLDNNNLGRFSQILNEIYVHPQYEYIEVYYDSWKGKFREKYGFIITGSYSGYRECDSISNGLHKLGSEGWNLILSQPSIRTRTDILEYAYIFNRKKTPLFDDLIISEYGDSSLLKKLHKSPLDNKTIKEEALEEYKYDVYAFQQLKKLSEKAYVILKIANLISDNLNNLMDLENWSMEEIMEIPSMELDIANEVINFIQEFQW